MLCCGIRSTLVDTIDSNKLNNNNSDNKDKNDNINNNKETIQIVVPLRREESSRKQQRRQQHQLKNRHERDLRRVHSISSDDNNQYDYFGNFNDCGAILIWDDLLLSVAHCHSDRDYKKGKEKVYLSSRSSSSVEDGTFGIIERTIVEATTHPNYQPYYEVADFMILKIDTPIKGIKPAVLNRNQHYPSEKKKDDNSELSVLNFASTDHNSDNSKGLLRETHVQYATHDECDQAWGNKWVNETFMLCAKVYNNNDYNIKNEDTCSGISGGPLLDSNGLVIGLSSWGHGCFITGNPQVYSRISSAVDWIDEQVCLKSSNPPSFCSNGNHNNNNEKESTGKKIQIDILFDDKAEETSWALINEDTFEKVYVSQYGDFSDKSNRLVSFIITMLQPGMYWFVIADNNNNGICCHYGRGYVSILDITNTDVDHTNVGSSGDNTGTILWQSNGKFSSIDQVTFKL